ncbi:hypothetical protein HDU98_011989 [Podochytrium sp. JEL0797]|nr:hypothetical protein HDU98_011989 [Podochytrium sp. JEL0797]
MSQLHRPVPPLSRGEKAYRDDLFDNIVHHLESLHANQWITTRSFDIMIQALLFDKTDPEGAAQGRNAAAAAAVPEGIDPSKLGVGGQGHSISVGGRKISIGNNGAQLVAVETFQAQQQGDLDFRRGDIIEHVADSELPLFRVVPVF